MVGGHRWRRAGAPDRLAGHGTGPLAGSETGPRPRIPTRASPWRPLTTRCSILSGIRPPAPDRRLHLRRPPTHRAPAVTEVATGPKACTRPPPWAPDTTAAQAAPLAWCAATRPAMLPSAGYHMGDHQPLAPDRRAARCRPGAAPLPASSASTGSARAPTASSSGRAMATMRACSADARSASTAPPAA